SLYMLFAAMVAGCGASSGTNGKLGPSATVVAAPPARLAESAWERISLPAPSDQVDGFAVAPRDPSTLFACTATPQPFALWRSTDAGAHWTRYVPLDSRGTDCAVSLAPDDPRRVTVQVSQFAPGEPLCGQDAFYLSTDGGASWRQLPHHALAAIAPAASVASGRCELQVTAHHLFVLSSFVPAPGAAQISRFARSDDDGATWTRADAGVGDG